MSNLNQHSSADAELDWLANCYVTGELNQAECEAFETRLGEDQAAREAVAAAVRLHTLLRAAITAPSIRSRRSAVATTLQRIALLAASCGAVAYLGRETQTAQAPVTTIAARDELASAWAGVVDVNVAELNEVALLRDTPSTGSDETAPMRGSDVVSSEPGNSAEISDGDSLAPPLWMLAALDVAATDTSGNDDDLEIETPSNGATPPASSTEESPDASGPEGRSGRSRPEGSGANISPRNNWMQA